MEAYGNDTGVDERISSSYKPAVARVEVSPVVPPMVPLVVPPVVPPEVPPVVRSDEPVSRSKLVFLFPISEKEPSGLRRRNVSPVIPIPLRAMTMPVAMRVLGPVAELVLRISVAPPPVQPVQPAQRKPYRAQPLRESTKKDTILSRDFLILGFRSLSIL